MAAKGILAFDTKDVAAPNSHARLLSLASQGLDDIALAYEFKVSIPTVRKWKQLPFGYQPPARGAAKRESPSAEPVGA